MISINIILIVAVLIEIITLFIRFILKINARDFFIKIMKYFGFKKIIRVHHFFLGIIIAVIAYLVKQEFLFNIGIGIVLSDMIHHLILQIVVGSHEIEFIYWLEKEAVKVERGIEKEASKVNKEVSKRVRKAEKFLIGKK